VTAIRRPPCARTRGTFAKEVRLLQVKRAHLELFARHIESEGLMSSTVARRLSTLASFYRYCHVEGVLSRDPAANVRAPGSTTSPARSGWDRNELGALLVQAGIGSARDHALVSLLALNGLRISEALNADIDDLSVERGAPQVADRAQGRQTGDDPARPTNRHSDRPVRQRPCCRSDLRHHHGQPDEPARCRPHGRRDTRSVGDPDTRRRPTAMAIASVLPT